MSGDDLFEVFNLLLDFGPQFFSSDFGIVNEALTRIRTGNLDIDEVVFANTTNTTNPKCEIAGPDQEHIWFTLIPAFLIVVVLSFLKRRKRLCMDCLDGRPGLVPPMNYIENRSRRLSFAAAFGTAALLCLRMVYNQLVNGAGLPFPVAEDSPSYFKVLFQVSACLIYGLFLYPIFVTLEVDSLISYIMGSLYVWGFTAIQIIPYTKCIVDGGTRAIMFFSNLPGLICMLFLCMSFPYRLVQKILERRRAKTALEDIQDFLKEHFQAQHVRDLLKKENHHADDEKSFFQKIKDKIVYKPYGAFRYSTRILSTTTVAAIVLYTLAYEFMVFVVPVTEMALRSMDREVPGDLSRFSFDTDGYNEYVQFVIYVRYFTAVFQACMTVSVLVSLTFGMGQLLHTFVNYRNNLRLIYKGDFRTLPVQEKRPNYWWVVSCAQFSGYQIAYSAWGFILITFMLCVLTLLIAIFVFIIIVGGFGWVIDLIITFLPVFVIGFVFKYIQGLCARFFFLQDAGQALAIDNRNALFIYMYFAFFLNIYIGLVSCVMKIIKGMVFGLLLIAKLDRSTLPRHLETMDPGYMAYMGMLHVDNAHTHPVLVTFIYVLRNELVKLKEQQKALVNVSSSGATTSNGFQDTFVPLSKVTEMELVSKETKTDEEVISLRSKRARTRWFLALTLTFNPGLQLQRKGHLERMEDKKKTNLRRMMREATFLTGMAEGTAKTGHAGLSIDLGLSTKKDPSAQSEEEKDSRVDQSSIL